MSCSFHCNEIIEWFICDVTDGNRSLAVPTVMTVWFGLSTMAEVQTETALNSIRFGFGYNGAILGAVCLVLCIMMNIDKYIEDIQRDLEAKRIK